MNKILYIFAICLLILTINIDKTKASHLMGTDMSFTCVGKDSFIIVMNAYRDCRGCLGCLANTETVRINSSCGNFNISLSKDTIYDVTNVCSSQCSRCTGACSFPYGIEKHIYSGLLVLPSNSCCDFTFSWNQCCRNSDVNTLQNPASVYYIEGKLNRCIEPCNNSPYFTQEPVAILCKGEDFNFNLGINETDGDSFLIYLTDPLTTNAQALSYASPYSKLEPLDYLGRTTTGKDATFPFGFHFDTITGDLKFRPMTVQNTVIAILVKEYRNDTLISEVRRDMNYIIVDCPENTPPVINSPYTFNVCSDSQIVIPVTIWDHDSTGTDPDSVFLDWNSGIQGATFESDPAPIRTTGYFTWTPSQNDVRSQAHRFVVIGHDNACPVVNYTARTFYVNVIEKPEKPQISGLDSICTDEKANYFISNYNSEFDYKWYCSGVADCTNETGGSAEVNFTGSGNAYIKVVVSKSNFCTPDSNEIKVIVNKLSSEPVLITSDNICDGDSAFYIIDNYNSNLNYTWKCSGSLECNDANGQNSWVKFISPNDGLIELSVTSAEGCKADTSISVTVNPVPEVPKLIGPEKVCLGDTNNYIIDNYNTKFNYNWNCTGSANCSIVNSNEALVEFADLENASIEVTVTSAEGCGTEKQQLSIIVYPIPLMPVVNGSSNVCAGDTAVYIIENFSTEFDYFLNCTGSADCISLNDSIVLVAFNSSDSAFIEVKVISPEFCGTQESVIIAILPQALPEKPLINGPDEVTDGSVETYFITNEQQGVVYTWDCIEPAECTGETGVEADVSFSSEVYALALIKVLSENNCGFDTSAKVVIVHPPPTSVESISDISSILIYPNPNDGKFLLKLNTNSLDNLKLVVYNSLGQKVFQNEYFDLNGNTEIAISLKNQPSGSYYLKLKTSEGEILRKLLLE